MNYVGREPAPAGVILVGDTNPVGAIAFFHAPPDISWLRLNGQLLAKANFPDLWAWAQGFLTADQVANPGLYKDVDAGTFALPKLDGLFIRAAGQVDANHIAAALGVKQADANVAHNHGIDRYNNPGANIGRIAGGGAPTGALADDVAMSGGTEARPVNVALVPCVKATRTTLLPAAGLGAFTGRLVQSRSHLRGDYLSQNVLMPIDDTIPQIAEGAEFLSVANFAPLMIGSRVRVSVHFISSSTGSAIVVGALFRSGTPDALAVAADVCAAADWECIVTLDHEFIAASLAPFTYSFRAGTGATAVRMNGRAGRLYGGAYNTYLRIDEFAP